MSMKDSYCEYMATNHLSFGRPQGIIGFEVATAVTVKNTDIRDIAPCSSERARSFRNTQQAKQETD
jgi:hypothetical protein